MEHMIFWIHVPLNKQKMKFKYIAQERNIEFNKTVSIQIHIQNIWHTKFKYIAKLN